MKSQLAVLDFLVIGAYFLFVFVLAWWVTVQEKRKKAESYGSSDYFLVEKM
ncbi:MAG: hypothetical protein R2879_08810 [Saprospiraceae bacterium]